MWTKLTSGLGGQAYACAVGAARRTLTTRVLSHSTEATAKATTRLNTIKANLSRNQLKAQLLEIRQKTDLSSAKSVGPK